jgi:hypothetical protein
MGTLPCPKLTSDKTRLVTGDAKVNVCVAVVPLIPIIPPSEGALETVALVYVEVGRNQLVFPVPEVWQKLISPL